MQYCPRLTHLSLTGVQTFLREDLTRFCRDAPPEFTHPQRDVFCVFSGEGVSRLREYLQRLAEDQEREGRVSRVTSGIYSEPEADSSRDTISDDGTIDALPQEIISSRPISTPRSTLHRSYADVVSGNDSNSPQQADEEEDADEGSAIPQTIRSRVTSLFLPRSSMLGSFTEQELYPPVREDLYSLALGLREGSRSVSEGEGSSSRPIFADSGEPASGNHFSPAEDPQSDRPLPPRPQWSPSGPSRQPYVGPEPINEAHRGTPSAGQLWTDTTAVTGSRPVPGYNGSPPRQGDSITDVIYDTDDDADMIAAQQHFSRRGRQIDGDMES